MKPRSRPARVHVLEREHFVPTSIDEAFAFFADAHNLERITPPWLAFHVVSEGAIEVRAGTTIDYRIRLLGFAVRWRSLIERFEPGVLFVDRMLEGPYRWWRHLHTFEAHEGGTILRDRVEYAVPYGPLAPIAHALFVRGRLRQIFDYRRDRIVEFLGASGDDEPRSRTPVASACRSL